MKVRGFDVLHVYYSRTGDRHEVVLYEQPLWRWVLAYVYHWYDMNVPQWPFQLLDRVVYWVRRPKPLEHLPFCCRQDLRCYRLSQRGRRVLLSLDLDNEDQVEALRLK